MNQINRPSFEPVRPLTNFRLKMVVCRLTDTTSAMWEVSRTYNLGREKVDTLEKLRLCTL